MEEGKCTKVEKMSAKGALFDLDGVLLDSEGIYTEFWSEMDRLFPTNVKDFAHVIKGTTLDTILPTYFPDKKVQEEIKRLLKEHEQSMSYRLFDGVIEFLDALKAHSIPAAIVTSSKDEKMESLFKSLPGFAEHFDVILTADDVTRSKPDPQGYMKAAERLGLKAEDCYVFEDSIAGVEAGCRAGAKVIGLATTNPAEKLNKADKVIDTLVGFGVNDMLAI
jgi:HAD superfamily hydrolase (TIGR01509 family)